MFKGRVTVLRALFCVGLVLAIDALVTFWWSREGKFVTTAFFLAVGSMVVPIGVKIGHLTLLEMARRLAVFLEPATTEVTPEVWFADAMEKRLRKMSAVYLFAGAFAILSLFAFTQGGAFHFPDTTAKTAFWLTLQMRLIVGWAGIMSGLGLGLIVVMASLIWEFDRFKVKLAPHMFGIRVVGDTLMKLYAMIALIWLVFSSSAITGLEQSAVPMAALAGLALLIFLVSFPLCLLPLHNRMVEEKQRLVVKAYGRLETLRAVELEMRDEAHVLKYGEAKREYEEALDLPEWPFGWKAVVTLTTSALVSNLPAIVGFATKNLFK